MAPDTPEPQKDAKKSAKPDDRSPDNARPTQVREPDNTRQPNEPTPRRPGEASHVADVENEGE